MLIVADWLIVPGAPPIRDAGIRSRGSRIDAVGTFAQLRRDAPEEPLERFPGCVLIPGLVNAHTRLSLTVLAGMHEPTDILGHLRRVNAAILAMSNDDLAASATAGALACLRSGVTSVGDIGYGPEPLAACADAGVGGLFCWEVRGIDEHALAGELEEMEFPPSGQCSTGRLRAGLSPQSAFASGPGLIKAEWHVARRHRTGFALHVAESTVERELMVAGSGPLLDFATRIARGFAPPRTGTVAYLESLGVLTDAVAIGCVHLEPGDAARLRKYARGVVVCPRTAGSLSGSMPPVADLYAAGVRVAIGTGTSATGDYDLFAEARALRKEDASMTPRRLIAMMTSGGARVLGIDDVAGSLEPGKQSDLAIVQVGPTEDPESALLERGGTDNVRAVMGAGVWRVRDGKISLPTASAERAAKHAEQAVRDALGA